MTTNDVEIAIIGAGFSGLGAAIKLKQAGFDDFVILDRGRDFGGTWRDNVYPGAACDVPSQLYSFSFAKNPTWSRSYSHQPEIHRYINGVADTYGIGANTRFGTEVTHAAWDDEQRVWLIDTERDGEATQVRANVMVGAVGPLCEPNLPDIEGIDGFDGKIIHSARWDTDYDFTGKRVAVIGTGASAIQLVPELAKVAERLDVYQRTAPWIVPRTERAYTGAEHWAYENVPGFQSAVRGAIYAANEATAFGLTYSPKALKPVELICRANIARGISDRALRKKATPAFQVGCKRILRSNDWYPAINRSNVDLVTDGIARVTPTGVATVDGTTRDVDVVVVATGFHVTDSPVFGRIVGKDGRSLAAVWDEIGMQGYKGSFVHGFPNMLLMVGPSTGLGHTSMVYMIESQLNYLVDYLKTARAQGITRTEVTESAQRGFNRDIQHALRNSVWVNGGCASWYKDARGNITTLWPGFTFNFRRATKHFDISAFEVSRTKAPIDTTSASTASITDTVTA
ncbi:MULTISPECIES: NAD(P)/FAD-dependent oxidoreductase [unclassified Gordonia (in: high G+C Gram-positive bacteria)]|uniref:flavin-containing monooxygenase n=1 Tax=unclassified Gordonia (in: high G+C Gram-positive bacteria) TaxID=2657482 RepID=UPI001F0F72F9|nr:NAD(P)/FAD-dependent oxidoreductase [Gordonia sp. ABSL49_1]MCH5644382.1 NAD(P)/FAD-dependent oxidoreductase [Gordonia sp. ABSL49_1]